MPLCRSPWSRLAFPLPLPLPLPFSLPAGAAGAGLGAGVVAGAAGGGATVESSGAGGGTITTFLLGGAGVASGTGGARAGARRGGRRRGRGHRRARRPRVGRRRRGARRARRRRRGRRHTRLLDGRGRRAVALAGLRRLVLRLALGLRLLVGLLVGLLGRRGSGNGRSRGSRSSGLRRDGRRLDLALVLVVCPSWRAAAAARRLPPSRSRRTVASPSRARPAASPAALRRGRCLDRRRRRSRLGAGSTAGASGVALVGTGSRCARPSVRSNCASGTPFRATCANATTCARIGEAACGETSVPRAEERRKLGWTERARARATAAVPAADACCTRGAT